MGLPHKRLIPPDKAAKALGVGLRVKRQARGLSQMLFSELCDLHPTHVSVIERGMKSPTFYTLAKIALVYEKKPSELLAEIGL